MSTTLSDVITAGETLVADAQAAQTAQQNAATAAQAAAAADQASTTAASAASAALTQLGADQTALDTAIQNLSAQAKNKSLAAQHFERDTLRDSLFTTIEKLLVQLAEAGGVAAIEAVIAEAEKILAGGN